MSVDWNKLSETDGPKTPHLDRAEFNRAYLEGQLAVIDKKGSNPYEPMTFAYDGFNEGVYSERSQRK